MLMINQPIFIQRFDLIKQIEEEIEPYRAIILNGQLTDIESLQNLLHGYHAACFSSANLRLSLKTTQHSSNELQSVPHY